MAMEVRISCINKNDRINPRERIVPTYPAEAAAQGVQDVVIVEFTVRPDGKVADTRVVRSVPTLDEAAIAAVQQWDFAGSSALGLDVCERQTVAVQFSLF
jgi:periplasmic protein TonB